MSWATHHLVLVITTKLDNGPGNNNLYTGEGSHITLLKGHTHHTTHYTPHTLMMVPRGTCENRNAGTKRE